MTLARTHEDMVRKWQHSHNTSMFTTPVVTIQDPGHDLFHTLVFGSYYNPNVDLNENWVERRQFSIYDIGIVMEMELCHPSDRLFEHWMRNSEAVIFIYDVSDRKSFLELPSASERACNAITPQPVIPQPGRGAFGAAGLARWILRRLHLRHSEAQPPPPYMVLAVSDMDPKSTKTRQVTSEEGERFSRSIGAIFVEVSCSWKTGIANAEARDDVMRELLKRVILKRVYVEKLAKEGKVVN